MMTSKSKRFRILEQELKKLRKYFLPHQFDSLGNYRERQIALATAYRVLAHAEFESYLEDIKNRSKDKQLPRDFSTDKFYETNKEYASFQAKWALLREQIVEKENLRVTDEEIELGAEARQRPEAVSYTVITAFEADTAGRKPKAEVEAPAPKAKPKPVFSDEPDDEDEVVAAPVKRKRAVEVEDAEEVPVKSSLQSVISAWGDDD